jgi:hypothetical protein
MKLRLSVVCALLCVIITVSAMIQAEGEDLLAIGNKYVKVFINNSQNETGRFAIDVTEGDPGRTDDDHKPLIYGHPKPWTSYTTIRINNENYVFGKATTKRPGNKLPDGEIIEPPAVVENRITMKCKYGAVVVEQILEITQSPTTGAPDTARIKYIIQNTGEAQAEIGLRTVLDTLVGANDGAPFRMGTQEITEECGMESKDYPDFWQAFDSLDQPSVIAQGTLRGGDVTPPDKIVFTNWGKSADYPWEIPIEPGVKFIRAGEDELDSTVTMFWLPQVIEPGATRVITLYCGLGGVTFSPGKTFLGISAPAEVQYLEEQTRSYTVVTYLEHRGEAKAKNVVVNLDLPAGLSLVSGETELHLDELTPGVTKQIAWEIKPDGLYTGDSSFQIRVAGEGLEPNQVARRINIIGPITLGATMSLPRLRVVANQWRPNPFSVKLELKNLDRLIATDIKATMSCDSGLKLAEGERSQKLLADMDPGKEATVLWKLNPLRESGTGKFKVTVTGLNTMPLVIPGEIAVPTLPASISFANPGRIGKGQVFSLIMEAYNLYNAKDFSLNLRYDPEQLRLVYVSRGTFLVENERLFDWSSGNCNYVKGLVRDISGCRAISFNGDKTSLVQLNFMAVGEGKGVIRVDKLVIHDSYGKEIPYEITPVKYQITEEKR